MLGIKYSFFFFFFLPAAVHLDHKLDTLCDNDRSVMDLTGHVV